MSVCKRCGAGISEEDVINYGKYCHRCYILVRYSKRTDLAEGLLFSFIGIGSLIYALIIFNSRAFLIFLFIGIFALFIGIACLLYHLYFIK